MTIQERVREAGEAKLHGVAAATHDHERDAMYAVLLDPKSNWPERPLTDEHTQEEIRRWLPSPPTSPSGTKNKGKGRKGGQQHQVPMFHSGSGNNANMANAEAL